MANKNNKENLILQLLNETLNENEQQSSSSKSEVDFNRYFEERSHCETAQTVLPFNEQLTHFLQLNQIDFCFSGHLEPLIKCIRFEISGVIVDFPMNWSIFPALLASQLPSKSSISFNKEHDPFSFISIFQSLLAKNGQSS
ncbi:MAG: hypothetical protein HQK50_03900, partial [Oligoflexia bacterium]|nr:hypothetical protein [Oligoflexia bacterium]